MHDRTLLERRRNPDREDDVQRLAGKDLAQAAGRDPAAFAQLYRQYVGRVYRYLVSRVGEAVEAEDLTSQVFSAAWEALPRYREQGSFVSWLFRIARNKVNDHYRRQRAQKDMNLSEALESGHRALRQEWDPLESLALDEDLRYLAQLLERLKPEERDLLGMRYAADLTYAEIARVLGRSEAAVKMAAGRLLRRLQHEWEAGHE